ncbi:MAG: hypothetical protein OEM32_07750 [Acidimicrobiia bacterium]|nr:hypothetical protein [Acidimicrobiia bacterium]
MQTAGNDSPVADGPTVRYFKDGATIAAQGHVKAGKKTGIWTYYYNNGQIQGVGRYDDDVISGFWKWYRKTGQLMQSGSFAAGKKTGVWTRYHRNGEMMDEGRYESDRRVGTWHYYDSDGNVTRSQEHRRRPTPVGS